MLSCVISNRLTALASEPAVGRLRSHASVAVQKDTAMSGGTADLDRADIAQVLTGAVDHFAVLIERHQGRIVSHLTRLVGKSDADDLTQDTFVRAYEALNRYDPTYPFRGWLLVIASRLAANHVAKRRERLVDAFHDITPPSTADDPAQHVAEHDAATVLAARIEQAMLSLSAESRALYELRFRQELSMAELANHFAISENALKVRIHRLRAQLAARLGIDLSTTDNG
jgi:RNA polymerase sigma factor (sigma-70 family)